MAYQNQQANKNVPTDNKLFGLNWMWWCVILFVVVIILVVLSVCSGKKSESVKVGGYAFYEPSASVMDTFDIKDYLF